MVGRASFLITLLATSMCAHVTAAPTSSMMVEMREITSVSMSPNAQLAVIGVSHDDPVQNRREISWVIVPLYNGKEPIRLGAGEAISDFSAPGALLNRRVLWSGDSQWFFYLRLERGEVQLWKTRSDGELTSQVTHSGSDVLDLAATSDPNEFTLRLGPDRAALAQAEESEYRNGILYDDHIFGGYPLTKTLPVIDRWRTFRRSDAGDWGPTGWTTPIPYGFDIRREKLLSRSRPQLNALGATRTGTIADRTEVIPLNSMPDDPHDYAWQYTLRLKPKGGDRRIVCKAAACMANRLAILGGSADDTEIYSLTDSGTGRGGAQLPGRASLYAWRPDINVARLICDSGGRLYNLVTALGLSFIPNPEANHEVVAAFASADQPPRVESINLITGSRRVIFDPNADLRTLTHGRATWISWKTKSGYPGRGIVILPDDYRAGTKYPAVVTSYSCGGFLNGGGADNAPEYVLAHYGFIAVCVDVTAREIIAKEKDLSRLYPVMCDIFLSLLGDPAVSGMIDADRVGLSGQSLGANAGAYCISRSSAFKAAAFRHGSAVERARWELFDTAAWRRDPVKGVYAQFHLPDPRHDPTGRWDDVSVALRAKDINTPLLLQLNDTEYLTSLPLWSAMRDAKKAVEMYVFPDETHLLIQPIHRLVNYERQIDWFRFWLKDEQDSDPCKREQYERWVKLRQMAATAQSQR